jgi:4-alpha-glucanotransferase
MLKTRQSGILLHPTSLAGPEGLGTLGEEAYAFVDFLSTAGQSIWQVLPLGPTGYGDCPYSAPSVFAGNPDLISLAQLARVGDLNKSDLPTALPAGDKINFAECREKRNPLLQKAANNFFNGTASPKRREQFDDFCQRQASWLNDYAFYQAMHHEINRAWFDWPEEVRDRHPNALHQWGTLLNKRITFEKYFQFTFFEQWSRLKEYANAQGVELFGDLPIFVAFDSVDVWANRELFQLDTQGNATAVAGVPPDYFSETGQLWGNPLYDWERMAQNGYSWWKARLQWNLEQCNMVRIDHFRGFEACWAVPATESTAINGTWQTGPGADFFEQVQRDLGDLPLIAEDLGIITPAVEQLRDSFKLPGMKILQFAFDSGAKNPYLPHQYSRNAVVYTGTHDNNTSLGWWQDLDAAEKERIRDYLDSSGRDMPWPLIRCALASSARLSIIPMQDILKLDGEARMNRPGTATGNWNWRLLPSQLDPAVAQRLRELCALYDRIPVE